MPETYRVLITPTAKAQLRDMAEYIAIDLDSPNATSRLRDYLQAQIRSLETMPERAPLAEDASARELGIPCASPLSIP